MKKLGRASILDVLKRAKSEFNVGTDGPYKVKFVYRDHIVLAFFDPAWPDFGGWVVSRFQIIYSRCVMYYSLGNDYNYSDAFFDF